MITPEVIENRRKLLQPCEAALAALQQKVEAEDKIVMENIFKAEMNFRKNAGNAIAERNALLSTNPDYFPHCISQITDLTPADASLLQHLKNIKTTYKAEGLKKRVTLVFEQNPLISNTELWIELTGTEQDVTFSGIEFLTSSKSEPKKNLKRSKPVDTPYVFFKSFEKDADEAEGETLFEDLLSIELNGTNPVDEECEEEDAMESED